MKKEKEKKKSNPPQQQKTLSGDSHILLRSKEQRDVFQKETEGNREFADCRSALKDSGGGDRIRLG